MSRVVAAVFPGRHDSTDRLLTKSVLVLTKSVLAAEVRILTGDEAVYSARRPGAISVARRNWAASGAVIAAVALAAWLGLWGSGALNAQARRNAELVSAQQGAVIRYGPREVYAHPGTATVVEWQHLLRQAVALDGVN